MTRGFLLALVVFLFTATATATAAAAAGKNCGRTPVIFNFGDSNSDTGGLIAGMGYYMGPPRGRTFFNRSTGRWGDGRLIIDFLCEKVNSKYLHPYLDSLEPDFTNGVNFAVAGAATLPQFVAFNLNIQMLQYGHFRNRTRELIEDGKKNMIDEEGFRDALYMFDIGQNDLAFAFIANLSLTQIMDKIPLYLSEIKTAIKGIYENGGSKFWVHNTGPLGCLPQKLSMFKNPSSEIDSCGCLAAYNSAARAFNSGLSALCDELRSEMRNATVVYTDVFAIEYDLICNHTKYGFENPLMACCGYGGPPYNYYKYNNVTCGVPGYTACPMDARYVSWDGVHYTDVANAFVASKILSSKYSKPRIKFQTLL